MIGIAEDSPTPSWLLRLLRRRSAAVVLGVTLIMDGCSQPPSTLIGKIAHMPRSSTHCRFDLVNMGLYRARTGRVYASENPPPAELADLLGAEKVGYIFFAPARPRESGLWALTQRGFEFTLIVEGNALSTEDTANARAALADILAVRDGGRLAWQAPMVRAGAAPPPQILWAGYAHNAVALALAAGLVVSIRSARSWPPLLETAEERVARALAAHRCPSCDYDTRGLPLSRCPECGHSW